MRLPVIIRAEALHMRGSDQASCSCLTFCSRGAAPLMWAGQSCDLVVSAMQAAGIYYCHTPCTLTSVVESSLTMPSAACMVEHAMWSCRAATQPSFSRRRARRAWTTWCKPSREAIWCCLQRTQGSPVSRPTTPPLLTSSAPRVSLLLRITCPKIPQHSLKLPDDIRK